MSIASVAFYSQEGDTPPNVVEELLMSRAQSPQIEVIDQPDPDAAPIQSRPSSPRPQRRPRVIPEFRATNPEAPTRNDLVVYASKVNVYVFELKTILDYLMIQVQGRPPDMDLTIHPNVSSAATIWKKVFDIGHWASTWERLYNEVQLN